MQKKLATILILIGISYSAVFSQNKSFGYDQLIQIALRKAGQNAVELERALQKAEENELESVSFLIAYMPEIDLQSLSADYILQNVRYALKAREEFPWCAALPDSVFLNDVLPYALLNERRDNWRADFYHRFSPLVSDCTNIFEVIDSINMNIREMLGVEYNTQRKKADQSPYESMEIGMASCSGLSILLSSAFRAVGIPSRIAGTPMWTNMRGNHSWSEVWIDGEWYFTEYYPDKLNHSWFVADAGRADRDDPKHWIYASSFKPTGLSFPLVWDENIDYVHAFDVTERYIELYRYQISEFAEDELLINIGLYDSAKPDDSDKRTSARISVILGEEEVDFGYSPAPYDDLNRFLIFRLKKNTDYIFAFPGHNDEEIRMEYNTGAEGNQILRLAF